MTYSEKGIKERLKEKVNLIKAPYQQIKFRKDKWGLLATVYFWGISRPVSFDRYDIEDSELWETIKHSIKSGSGNAVMELKLRYGNDAHKFINGTNLNAL